jgi:hypothetical protein
VMERYSPVDDVSLHQRKNGQLRGSASRKTALSHLCILSRSLEPIYEKGTGMPPKFDSEFGFLLFSTGILLNIVCNRFGPSASIIFYYRRRLGFKTEILIIFYMTHVRRARHVKKR